MVVFWRVLSEDLRSPVPYVVWASLTVLFGLSGPFGSYDILPLGARLLFWAAGAAVATWVGISIRAFVHGVLGLSSFWPGAVVTAVLVCAVLTPPTWIMVELVLAPSLGHLPTIAEVAVFLFTLSLATGAFRQSLRQDGSSALVLAESGDGVETGGDAAPGAPPAMPVAPRLLDRLPEDRRGDLVSLRVRDHYVDVETTLGPASLLMRLSDAIAETAGVDGAQVHRSHWVAWPHVRGVERSAGKLHLVLSDGRAVPVSRNYRKALEERGLI